MSNRVMRTVGVISRVTRHCGRPHLLRIWRGVAPRDAHKPRGSGSPTCPRQGTLLARHTQAGAHPCPDFARQVLLAVSMCLAALRRRASWIVHRGASPPASCRKLLALAKLALLGVYDTQQRRVHAACIAIAHAGLASIFTSSGSAAPSPPPHACICAMISALNLSSCQRSGSYFTMGFRRPQISRVAAHLAHALSLISDSQMFV